MTLLMGSARAKQPIFNLCVCFSHLEHQQEQEVGISDPLELLKQVERQEAEEIVLGGLDSVCLEKDKTER